MSPRPTHQGFTLVELLVVVLIIGILAAIALPRLLGQRTRAKNAAAQAAVRHALLAARSYYTQNSETYVGLGPAQLQGYESSLGSSEPADGVKPGDAAANPQNIWIGNGINGTNPDTVANGDSNGGSTVVLCSVSRGDTVYCVKDVSGVASYFAFSGAGASAGANGDLYSSSGWSSTQTSSLPTAGTPSISGTTTEGSQLTGSAGTWSASFPAITNWSWVWQRCDSSGNNCNDVTSSSGSANGAATPTVGTYALTSDDVGFTIRLQVKAQTSPGSCMAGSNCSTGTSAQTAAVAALNPCPGGVQSPARTCTYDTAGVSYTWTAPGGITSVTVKAWGGGQSGSKYGSGGAGGESVTSQITVSPGNQFTLVVGGGGAAGHLAPGGNSTFGNTVLARGGGSGATSSGDSVRTGGAGGGSNSKNYDIYGGGGGSSAGTSANGVNGESAYYLYTYIYAGAGGTAPAGGGNGGGGAIYSGSGRNGYAGAQPGGGGGGASYYSGMYPVYYSGGAGGAGRIIVSW